LRYGAVPVLFYLGLALFRCRAVDRGRWEFLPEPFEASELLAAVRRILSPAVNRARSAS